MVSLILSSFSSFCTKSARPISEAGPRHLWPSHRVTAENFSGGPVGNTGSGGGRTGRAWENLVQSGPQAHPFGWGSTGFRRSTVSAGPSTAQQPNSQPFDFPLMSLEELLCPALRNVCPSHSASPLGSSRRISLPAQKTEDMGVGVGGKSSHSCTSQISESSGGSFLSCRRSANTCSEWTLLSVRRLTSFISIRGNISRSWGKEGTKYSFCLSPGKGARVGELWERQQIVCARCRQGRILEGKVGVSGDEPLGKRRRGEGRLTWGWWMET